MPLTLRMTLAFLFCVLASVLIRQTVPAPAGIVERVAIAAIWIAGLAYMIRARLRN